MSITVDIYKFIAQHSGVTRSEMLLAFPDLNRDAVISAYDRLYRSGKVSRMSSRDDKRGYQYLVTDENKPGPEEIPQDMKRLQAIVETAESLEKRGLYRRAATVWLEAYDCAQRHADRERYAKRRRRCLTGMTSGTRDGSAGEVVCYAEVSL